MRRLRVLTGAVLLATATAGVRAASPTFWQVATQADFLEGEVEQISIDSNGRVLLGPAAELVHEAATPFVWRIVADRNGVIWAGTGNEGQLYRSERGGFKVVHDATEIEIHAVAPAPDGGVYIGTSPDGRVLRISRDGQATPVFDPDDKYIWALSVGPDGQLYVATGDRGTIYRVGKNGEAEPYYRTSATHVTSLAWDRKGALLASTESPGQVLRIEAQDKAFVLLDSTFREVRALTVDEQGNVYAAALNARPSAEDKSPERPERDTTTTTAPVPSVSTEITITAIGDVSMPVGPGGSTTRREDRREVRGTVYRIAPNGLWDTLWESRDDTPYDLSVEPGGALLIATGPDGKIFRIEGEPVRTTLLTRAAAQQVTSFARDAKGTLYFATSNPGKVFRLEASAAEKGTYLSEVRDATTVAAWGAIRWQATTPSGTSVEISTRSGNTPMPDATWSSWSSPYRNATGEQISSPNARYLQWRAVLTGSAGTSPILTSVTAAYLPRNLRPSITSITVHPPGTAFQRPFTSGEMELAGFDSDSSDVRYPGGSQSASVLPPTAAPTLGRRVYQKGLQTFVWKADDTNDDRLQFDVFYRREGETVWKPLKRGLWDPIFTWDTTSVPDGTYLIKVVASDAPSNSPATALTVERESPTFDIDNTPPTIEVGPLRSEAGTTRLSFTVRDEQSPVQRVEYSLDASRWRVVYPKDGIPDSRTETFDLVIEGDQAGSVIVRATDALNNVSTTVAARRGPRSETAQRQP